MDRALSEIVTVLTGVIGVAILAVLVSKNAQTGQVLTSAGQAFGNILSVAEAPVTGGSGIGGSLSMQSLNGGQP